MRLPTPEEAKESCELSWVRFERARETYIFGDGHADAALECDSVLGRLLFLRLLTIALERCGGSLDQVPSLAADPETRNYLKQVTSLGVIEKILKASYKRHITEGLHAGNSYVERGELMRARWKYLATAELASILIDFELNPWFARRRKEPLMGVPPSAFTLLERAGQVCAQLGQRFQVDAAMFEAAILNDPRYKRVRDGSYAREYAAAANRIIGTH